MLIHAPICYFMYTCPLVLYDDIDLYQALFLSPPPMSSSTSAPGNEASMNPLPVPDSHVGGETLETISEL